MTKGPNQIASIYPMNYEAMLGYARRLYDKLCAFEEEREDLSACIDELRDQRDEAREWALYFYRQYLTEKEWVSAYRQAYINVLNKEK